MVRELDLRFHCNRSRRRRRVSHSPVWFTSATDHRESLYSKDVAPSSKYGSATAATSSGSASSSPSSVAPSDHTKNTSVIVGGAVGGAVGFVVLLLAVYMTRSLFKRRSVLRVKRQANTECMCCLLSSAHLAHRSDFVPPVQARLTLLE
ncbi:hypothetical protein M378DRAFT_421568 [Amanita muscaria Koide BX008]|uniref:Uncharacterized protein n=1 Tax=Amanita muscaria (strain Koide BX008) TaxID=946122 RepID=A0A0C2S380_AMAMK|nr:hypothetical protein M378DRAFT_421568 [Amanita muscaria Koide BX008]